MPINESSRVPRERWPLQFDLEGVPRDNAERERLLQSHQNPLLPEVETGMPVTNNFAASYNAGETVIDINNPPQKRYVHQEYPKMVFHGTKGKIVKSREEEEKLLASGHTLKPAEAGVTDHTDVYQNALRRETSPIPELVDDAEVPEKVPQAPVEGGFVRGRGRPRKSA